MVFVTDDLLRIINNDGIDCLLAFKKKDAPNGIKIVSYCKRDNWNPDLKKGKHCIM